MGLIATPARASAAPTEWTLIEGQPQGLVYAMRPPGRSLGKPPVVIYHHGAGGAAQSVLTSVSEQRILRAVAAAGYLVLVSDFGGNLWGNQTNHAHIDDLITLGQAIGGRPGPVALLGMSMGGGASLSFAGTHREKVACVAGILPVINLMDLYGLAPDSVVAAYPGGYFDDVQGPRHSPLVMSRRNRPGRGDEMAGMFSDMPIRIWQATRDTTCTPDALKEFVRNVRRRSNPRVQVFRLPGQGHTLEALDKVDLRTVVKFMRAHLPV